MRLLTVLVMGVLSASLLTGCGTAKAPAASYEKTEAAEEQENEQDNEAVTETAEKEQAPETSETKEEAAETPAEGSYISGDGWKTEYDSSLVEVHETEEGVNFVYVGDCAGSNVITISYIEGKQPQEVLYEKTADVDESRVTRVEGWFGTDPTDWSFSRLIPPAVDGSGVGEQFTAVEHNGGVLLIECLYHEDPDEGRAIAVGDTMADVLDRFEFTNHEKQKQFEYVPGIYVQELEDEYEGQKTIVTYSIELRDDHTGIERIQDDMDIYWTSTEIVETQTGFSYEYAIEGDRLLINQNGTWNEFIKNN